MAYTEKYVTQDGAGAHDGTSLANAWSFAEMLSNQVAGERANVFGDVTYASSVMWTNDGTSASSMAIRGCNAALGDLDTPQRTSGGALVKDDFPVITLTAGGGIVPLVPSNFLDVSNLHIHKTASTAYCIEPGSNTYGVIRNCVIEDSSSGEAVKFSSSYMSMANCDIINNHTSLNRLVHLFRGSAYGCRITNPGGGSGSAVYLTNLISGISKFQFLDCGTCVEIAGANQTFVTDCSARNCDTFIDNGDTTNSLLLANNVAWGSNAAGSEFIKCDSDTLIGIIGNGYGNFADANQNIGNSQEILKVALSADPFESSSDLSLNNTAGGGAALRNAGALNENIGPLDPAAGSTVFQAHAHTIGM